MADHRLAGNGVPCKVCGGLDREKTLGGGCPPPCDACGGLGRVAIPAEDIVATQLAENRALRNSGARD